jgi:hypothetical protein
MVYNFVRSITFACLPTGAVCAVSYPMNRIDARIFSTEQKRPRLPATGQPVEVDRVVDQN